jgi:hypothetical protein
MMGKYFIKMGEIIFRRMVNIIAKNVIKCRCLASMVERVLFSRNQYNHISVVFNDSPPFVQGFKWVCYVLKAVT